MAKTKIAQLSRASVGVHRIIGRDENGFNLEEKVPTLEGEFFCDRGGNVVHVALCNHRVTTRESLEKYGAPTRRDIIREGGLPMRECPYTERYMDLVSGPLVRPPKGQKDCGGQADGCEHWHKVRDKRSASASERAKERKRKTVTQEAAEQFMRNVAQFAQAGAPAKSLSETRDQMRVGAGE